MIRSACAGILAALMLTATAAAAADTECTPAIKVARSAFSHQIAHREPVGRNLRTLDPTRPHLFFFTEVLTEEGTEIEHRWTLDGQSLGSPELAVGPPRWRTWSRVPTSLLLPGLLVVEVADAQGCVAHAAEFRIASAAGEPELAGDDTSLAAQRARARALLEQAMTARQEERFEDAAEHLEATLPLVAEGTPDHASLLDELNYHLPLARARAFLRQQDAAAMRAVLEPVPAYLRDHPRSGEYGRALENYFGALRRLEREP